MQHQIEFPRLGLELTLNEVAFSIGNVSINWYGVLIGIGFLLAFIYAAFNSKKIGLDLDKLIDVILFGMIGGIIGARLYFVIFYDGTKYLDNPIEILMIRDGGLGFYGGLIGGLLVGCIVAKIKKMNIPALLDYAALGFLIGQSLGRWGNFFNQEAFGTETTLPWGMRSDNTLLSFPGTVHPCFLYESIACIIGFLLLHIFTHKFRRYNGQTFLLYLVWYGSVRFFIEGLRTDSLIIPMVDLRVSQVLSLVFVLLGVLLLIIFRRRTKLVGSGSRHVMEANEENLSSVVDTDIRDTELSSTIFDDNSELLEQKDSEHRDLNKELKNEISDIGESKKSEDTDS